MVLSQLTLQHGDGSVTAGIDPLVLFSYSEVSLTWMDHHLFNQRPTGGSQCFAYY